MQYELKNFGYSFKELNINSGLIETEMGYGEGQSPEPFPEMIADALEQCNHLCDIQGCLLISDYFYGEKPGSIVVGGTTFDVGKKIAHQLKNVEGSVLFICTAGAGIGVRSQILMAKGDLIEGYILDTIGSVTVEAAIDKIQKSIENELIIEGIKISNRYSPGYCGWALNEQKQLFAFFPNNQAGIKLSDSCLMDPVKSVSGIFGFGRKVKKKSYQCQMCELETCIYRRIRLTKVK